MSKQSSYQAFPTHKNTFQGTASSVTLVDKPWKVIHLLADGDITYALEEGGTKVFTGLPAQMDIVVPGNAITVTSSADVLIS